jgi:hypothetical protein
MLQIEDLLNYSNHTIMDSSECSNHMDQINATNRRTTEL